MMLQATSPSLALAIRTVSISAALLLLGACKGVYLAEKPALRRVELAVDAQLRKLPAGAKEATIWVPAPSAGPYQELGPLDLRASQGKAREAYDEFGNRILSVTGKPEPGKPLRISYRVTLTRLERKAPPEIPEGTQPTGSSIWLRPARRAPIQGRHRQLLKLTGNVGTYGGKVFRIFEHVTGTLGTGKPSPTRQRGVHFGEGQLDWIEREKVGNSVDFSSMFVAYCQTIRVPASFEAGYRLPKERSADYRNLQSVHCWSRARIPGEGWLPIDCYQAALDPVTSNSRFGGLDTDRILLSRGRDLALDPPQKQSRLNYFVYPIAEVDGQIQTKGLEVRMRFRDLPLPPKD